MSVPFDIPSSVLIGSRISMLSLWYGLFQLFYILLRPPFSAPCRHRQRVVKTAGFLVSAGMAMGNLVLSGTVYRGAVNEDVVQGSAAAVALFHGGLYWAYTRVPLVFMPFVHFDRSPPMTLTDC